jgi:hypothetical protein
VLHKQRAAPRNGPTPNRRARAGRRTCPGTHRNLPAGGTAAGSVQGDVRRAGHQRGGSSRVRDEEVCVQCTPPCRGGTGHPKLNGRAIWVTRPPNCPWAEPQPALPAHHCRRCQHNTPTVANCDKGLPLQDGAASGGGRIRSTAAQPRAEACPMQPARSDAPQQGPPTPQAHALAARPLRKIDPLPCSVLIETFTQGARSRASTTTKEQSRFRHSMRTGTLPPDRMDRHEGKGAA